MEIIKKYTAIQIETNTVNRTVKIELEYGEIEGQYYSQERPETEFDTEDEALEYAYKKDKYATSLIVPIVKFEFN